MRLPLLMLHPQRKLLTRMCPWLMLIPHKHLLLSLQEKRLSQNP